MLRPLLLQTCIAPPLRPESLIEAEFDLGAFHTLHGQVTHLVIERFRQAGKLKLLEAETVKGHGETLVYGATLS